MRNTADQKPINTEHGLWGKQSSKHPFHKAFKSTLCVSAAALVISSITAKAGVIDRDAKYADQRSNATPINETVTVTEPSSEVIGIEIFSTEYEIFGTPANTTFTNTGTIDMDYLGVSPNVEIAVTGIESVIDSSVTIDNQADITLQAKNTNDEYYSNNQAGATGIDSTGDVINSATISATASNQYNYVYYGNNAEATGIASDGDVTNSAAIAATASNQYSYSYDRNDAEATGIVSTGNVVNSAAIAATASNQDSYAYYDNDAKATGIKKSGDVTNSAAIAATASNQDSFTFYGNNDAEASGIESSGNVVNSASISATASNQYSIAFYGNNYAEATGIVSTGSVSNSAEISATASTQDSYAKYGNYAEATGIEADSDITNESTGAITVSAASGSAYYVSEANATGLYSKYGSIDNSANIEVTAKGGESYYYSGATAHGIYAEDSSVNNRGDITVMAASGSSYEESHVEAYGIYAENDIENTGDISVSATTVRGADASYADAGGLDSWYGDITNSGNITVQATAADANAVSDAEAFGISAASNIYNSGDAKAEGLVNDNGYLVNTGSITVEATSGSARKMSRASVVGISANVTVENSGAIAVTGSAADSGYIVTEVVGINTGEHPDIGDGNKRSRRPSYSGGDVLNTSAITVTSTTGDGYAIRQHAQGINAYGDVANDGAIQVTATSGSASYENFIQAMGISSTGDVTNTGSITIASTIDYAGVSSGVKAYGIYADYDIDNSGSIDITVTTGGAKKGHNYADAQGLRADEGSIVNDATVTIKATSGQAGDVSWADAEGIDAVTDLDNSGAVRVTATSGDAGFISDAEAEGLANDDGYLANTGSITVEGTSGDAYISSASAVAIQSDSIYGVTNQGDISVSAQSGTADKYGSATAEGITLRGDEGATIDNAGSVYVSAHSGQAMESIATSVGISVANTDYYYGPGYYYFPSAAALPAEPSPESTLINAADVTVIATSNGVGENDAAKGSMAFAGAIGLSANGTVENSGAIAVTGTAADSGYIVTEVVGINTGAQPYIGGGGKRAKRIAPSYYGGDVFNSSAITVTSTTGDGYAIRQNARGINAYGDVTNDGTIQVTATSGSAAYDNSIQAMGIYSTGDVTNSGSITVDATRGDSSYFKYGYGEGLGELNGGAGIFAYGSINNAGDITVTTTNGNLLTTGPEPASANAAMAAGLVSFYGDVTNTGNITVDVATGNSYGSKNVSAAFGIVGTYGGNITNEGTITVAARTGASTNPDDAMSMAAGIMLFNGGTVHSSGLINVTADSGYQVMNVGGNVATMTGFAMEFGASQELLDEMYTGCLGGNIAFSDDAMLYVYAGDGMFEGENTYLIPVLLEEDVDGGIERGYFADYQFATASPYYEITYMSPKSDGELQEISIEFSPEIASPQYAASVRNFMFDQMNGIVKNSLFTPVLSHMLTGDPTQITYDGVLLASTNPIPDTSSVITQTPRKKSSVFVQPFYTDTSNSSDPMGYDADIYGLTGGYNYHVNGNLIVGVHAGYGNADVDYSGTGYDFRSEDIDSISFGVHGIHRFADNWLGTATATFFYTDNDYMDQSPTNRETADYNTYGTEANIDLGYIFNFGNHHIIPEIGLTYLWQHNESYTTDNLDNQDITFGSMDEHELYARLGVSWYGNFIQEKWQIVPNLSIGLEEALTDGELSSTMSNGRAITTVESDFGDTTFTANAGIEFSNDRYTFAAGYAGSYSSDLSDSSIFLQAVYRF